MAITETKGGRLGIIFVVVAVVLGAFLLYGWYGARASDQATDRMERRLRSAYDSTSPEHVQDLWLDSLTSDSGRLAEFLGEVQKQPIAFGEEGDQLRGRWQVNTWGVETCVVVSWGDTVHFTQLDGSCPLAFES